MKKWTKTLPDSVKIGYLKMRLRLMADATVSSTEHLGFCDTNNEYITIMPALRRRKAAEVLIHEIIHACFNTYHPKYLPQEKELIEDFVTAVSKGMSGIFVDSPEVIEWLIKYIKHEDESTSE